MSATHLNDYEQASTRFPCGHCDAAPDEWCRSSGGSSARYLHESRNLRVLEVARLSGYTDLWDTTDNQLRAVQRAIRSLHAEVDGDLGIDNAWLRVRLSEILAIR